MLNRYFFFLCAFTAYLIILRQMRGLPVCFPMFFTEGPLVLAIYWYCVRILRPVKSRNVLAALPVFLIYAVHDAYYHGYGEMFRLAYLHDAALLLEALPAGYCAVLLAVFALPCALFLFYVDWRRKYRHLAAAALAAGLWLLFPGVFVRAFAAINTLPHDWDDYANASDRGRLTVMLNREALRRFALHGLAKFRDGKDFLRDAREQSDFIRKYGSGRNVHLVMLESLLDPALFRGLGLSHDPYHPDFRKFFGGNMGFSVSPVFGGETPQAEFELLCGAPAYKRLYSMEFNGFTGAPVQCLPNVLRGAGYRTVASHPYVPQWNNYLRAYPALGFGEMYFPKRYFNGPTYFSIKGVSPAEGLLFDGDLFRQTSDFLEKSKGPLFDYIVGIYGHFPFRLDAKLRPPFIAMTAGGQQLVRVVNQFYYRTQAISEFVRRTVKREPKCLIIMVGDHLPSVDGGVETYRQLRYLPESADPVHTTRILIVKDGKPVKYPVLRHSDIPAVIADYLTGGKYCKKWRCAYMGNPPAEEESLSRYMHIMADGVK